MNILERIMNLEYPSFRIIIPNSERVLYFRMLSLKEYEKFSTLRNDQIVTEWEFFEQVFKYCYLDKYYLLPDDIPAGFTISIGKLVMYISGDCDRETILEDIERARQENPANTLLEYMRTVIFTVFSSYSLEDIESWDRKKFLKTFTIAENVLSKQKEDFKHMDLRELSKSMNKKSKNPNGPIDFERENRAIRGNTSLTEREDILSKEQLSKLSKTNR